MRGADGRCWKAVPDDIHPERGQVAEYLCPDRSSVKREDVGHVFHQHISGPKLANGSEHLSPQNGLGVIETVPLSGRAGAFAGEAAGEELDAGEAMAEVSNIVKDSGSGPTAGETGAAFLVLLAEPEVVDASVGETEVEEPGSGEC